MEFSRIKHYFPDLSELQYKQLEQLKEAYTFWNAQINVISRKDIDNFFERHVLHSLAIYKYMPFTKGSKILDVGTGGGFPGIPLAIVHPECQFHLVDSIGKKIKVVEEVVNEIGLTNVTFEQIRAEQINDTYDFVVSRAVTRMKPFLGWTQKKVHKNQNNQYPNGVLALKGGDLFEELKEVKKHYRLADISTYYREDFFETKKVVYVRL